MHFNDSDRLDMQRPAYLPAMIFTYHEPEPPRRKHFRNIFPDGLAYPPGPEQLTKMRKYYANCCAICMRRRGYLVVDHDHDSGMVRGLLCHHCNAAEGMIRATGMSAQAYGAALATYLGTA